MNICYMIPQVNMFHNEACNMKPFDLRIIWITHNNLLSNVITLFTDLQQKNVELWKLKQKRAIA